MFSRLIFYHHLHLARFVTSEWIAGAYRERYANALQIIFNKSKFGVRRKSPGDLICLPLNLH